MDLAWITAVAGACLAALVGLVRRRRVLAARREARAAKDRERASIAERELAAERARVERMTDERRRPLAALSEGRRAVSESRDESAVAKAVADALERTFDPAQVMVFLAADTDGKEFVLAATSGRHACAWPLGARLTDTTGRLGLVARRGVAMDEREFAAELTFVRDQFETTEPAAFRCEVAAPVVVDGVVRAVFSVGGSTLPADATRGGVELLASCASDALRGLDVVRGSREFALADPR